MSQTNTTSNLEELMDQYGHEVLRICYVYMKNQSLAEDAYQETFLKVYKSYGNFKGQASIRTWIIRIAINTCKDMQRTRWFKQMFLLENQQPEDFYTIEDAILEADERTQLRKIIWKLPSKYKDIILLHYYEDLSVKEISEVLSLSESKVKNRLFRGRHLLRNSISIEGMEFK